MRVSKTEIWAETGVVLIIVVAAYSILKQFNIISFSTGTEGLVGLGSVLLIGVTASFSSCLALVGGLLLSVSAKWSESRPSATHWQKFAPLLNFNIGRLAGYFFFGGLTGLLGQTILMNARTTGIIKVLLALLMVWIGLTILHLVPKKYCHIPLPKKFLKRVHGLAEAESRVAPFVLGAATFFIPCGFTQSMQLLALGSGSFVSGGVIMLVFALGTLPALLGISAASSFAEGHFGRIFFRFAGIISLLLGIINLQNGLLLTGFDVNQLSPFNSAVTHVADETDPNVSIDQNGQQIISVEVHDSGYIPTSFTVAPGLPTWIYAVAPEGLSGCISTLTAPAFDIQTPLKKGENWVGPFKPTKDFSFMCSMGMFRADVHVKSS
jgi:sulfite exporter TauE/SafE